MSEQKSSGQVKIVIFTSYTSQSQMTRVHITPVVTSMNLQTNQIHHISPHIDHWFPYCLSVLPTFACNWNNTWQFQHILNACFSPLHANLKQLHQVYFMRDTAASLVPLLEGNLYQSHIIVDYRSLSHILFINLRGSEFVMIIECHKLNTTVLLFPNSFPRLTHFSSQITSNWDSEAVLKCFICRYCKK